MNTDNNNGFDIKMGRDIYSNSPQDIYSGYEDISSDSGRTSQRPKRKKKRKKHLFLKFFAVLLCLVLIFGIGFYAYGYRLIDKITRVPLDTANLGISTSNYSEVKNIALLGLDTRDDNKIGRSDANVILTVDKAHKKIKLTSIARDSYVSIDGHSKDKLTHAYAYGRSQLSVKTLNQNFGLEITDYVTMNFFELARIIDYIGGVVIDVDEAEMQELNSYIFPRTDLGDIPCEDIPFAGKQTLSGGQAVCYARIRHTDGDIERGNRQKEVLTAMFAAVKKMNPLKLPELASLVIAECETSLSTDDIIEMGLWAVFASPEFEQLSIPNDNVPAQGKTVGGKWCYVYDLEKAAAEIEKFILEN
ncbi:MAG: LCP family protein [Clostridia bacterium]|nr:LCP family protein [Clostridia bacterium]